MELNLPRGSSYRLKIPRRRTREEAILREFLRPDDAGNGLRVRANPSWSLKGKLERRIIGQPAAATHAKDAASHRTGSRRAWTSSLSFLKDASDRKEAQQEIQRLANRVQIASMHSAQLNIGNIFSQIFRLTVLSDLVRRLSHTDNDLYCSG
jgi:hypothetical protein